MGLLTKKTIRTLALSFISIFLITNIIAIILTGMQYRYVGPDFISNPYHALPGLEVATVVYTFAVALFGIIVFVKPNIAMTITVRKYKKIKNLVCHSSFDFTLI